MSTKTITCPSGLVGEIRNFKAKELSILADPANAQAFHKKKDKGVKAHPLDPVYDGCWLKTVDPGPYPTGGKDPGIKSDGRPNWPELLTCDRFFTLIQMRHLTYGPFNWKQRCKNTLCEKSKKGKGFLWDADLTALKFKELPAESRKKVTERNLVFELELGGKKTKFKLLTGKDEANTPTLSEDVPTAQKMLAQLATRIYTVEGIPDDDDEARIEWVGELDAPELFAASNAMDAVDGGVETRTVVVCSACDEEFTVDIPFGDPGFLAPTPS